MAKHWSPMLVIGLLLGVCGCQTTRGGSSEAPDYRQDQADRQTQRDAESATKKNRRPLDDRTPERQDVIDQPR